MEQKFSDLSPSQSGSLLIAAEAGEKFDTGRLGIHWKINGAQTGGRFSVVHHELPPRTLAAPLHRHHREDEYSYVLLGSLGALLGDDVVRAEQGAWVFKPRGQWHTFWNAADTPCGIIEVISPGGFEEYFREMRAIWPNRTKAVPLLQKYELDMDFDSVPRLCARFGLT
ncbi:cupin domain-containing protein [Bradyrhizobium barranii]|uniref:Cupin domain-containing protein n=1 Tax=Bradyrhizobium barranii TaxID=2992140 RepID=A0ABY3QHI8_9BRAD|nr:cupin domain-containing protein [Bradyrhizobium japonicum]UFW85061.1 cupin domain-containing protein [Bradyrhizobium japonicum]